MTHPTHYRIDIWDRPGLAGWAVPLSGRAGAWHTGAWMGLRAREDALADALALVAAEPVERATVAVPADLYGAAARLAETGMIDDWLTGRLAEIKMNGLTLQVGQEDHSGVAAAARAALHHYCRAAGNALLAKLRWSDDQTPAARARILLDEVGRPLVATALGVQPRTVHAWSRRGIAAEHVEALAHLTGVPTNLLRKAD